MGSELRRSFAPMAVLLLPAIGCSGPDQGSTLPSDGEAANPTGSVEATANSLEPGGVAGLVEARARDLVARPWAAPDEALPPGFNDLDYAEYQAIRFRPDAALWRDRTPFEVQLLPRGSIFRAPVRIHIVEGEEVSELPFDPSLFTFAEPLPETADEARSALGYSGFRVHYPLNESGVADEVVVFQGASYFRMLGPGQVHGLSGRGLAIDIGEYAGEEFPYFTDFWLVRPDESDASLVFHALLDSPSVTGAYRFEVEPGTATVLSVDARLFAREDVHRLGVAPFSSMYLYGPSEAARFDDFRSQVHDSDGLMMLTRVGEWIWRPLANRRHVRVTRLQDGEPQGFGLAQRARDFDDYLDLETRYHQRPSAWVVTEGGDWGVGGVELLEAPTDSEFADNVAAAWVPEVPFLAGEARRYRYRVVTFDRRLDLQTLAQVERTRTGHDALPGQTDAPPRSHRRIVVDFADGPLDRLDGEAVPEPVVATSAGEISDIRTVRLPDELGWRVSFRLVPVENQPADMRLHLELEGERVSETWSYVWYPPEVP